MKELIICPLTEGSLLSQKLTLCSASVLLGRTNVISLRLFIVYGGHNFCKENTEHSLAKLRLSCRLLTFESLVLVGRCGLELHVCLLTLCEVYCSKSTLKSEGMVDKNTF